MFYFLKWLVTNSILFSWRFLFYVFWYRFSLFLFYEWGEVFFDFSPQFSLRRHFCLLFGVSLALCSISPHNVLELVLLLPYYLDMLPTSSSPTCMCRIVSPCLVVTLSWAFSRPIYNVCFGSLAFLVGLLYLYIPLPYPLPLHFPFYLFCCPPPLNYPFLPALFYFIYYSSNAFRYKCL